MATLGSMLELVPPLWFAWRDQVLEARPRLIELMKVAIYEVDRRNRQLEIALNIDSQLRELGLHELMEGLTTTSRFIEIRP